MHVALGHEFAQSIKQLGLAVEAAGAVVGPVGGIIQFAGFDEFVTDADPGGKAGGVVALGLGQTWRNGGDGERA